MFARSFVQWMSSSDKAIAEHVAERLSLDRQAPGYWYWGKDEFKPVHDAMSKFFHDRQMLVGTPGPIGLTPRATITDLTPPTAEQPLIAPAQADVVPPYPGPTEAGMQVWRMGLDQSLKSILSRYPDMTQAEYEQAVAAKLERALGDNPQVRMRIPHEALPKVVADGRFKSQFETQTSGGFLDNDYRAKSEDFMFGYPEKMPPRGRPLFGYIAGSADEGGAGIAQYGDIMIEFKPEVNSRATFSLVDSLHPGLARDIMPPPLSDPGIGAWDATRPDILKEGDSLAEISHGYTEAQIHGGLSTDDIEEIVFSKDTEIEALKNAQGAIDIYKIASRRARDQLANPDLPPDQRAHFEKTLAKQEQAIRDYTARARELADMDSYREHLTQLGIPWRLVKNFDALDNTLASSEAAA
jgi:hypothetical protein